MDTINIAILMGLLFIVLAITIIKLELVFRSVLNSHKKEELPSTALLTSKHVSEEKGQHIAK